MMAGGEELEMLSHELNEFARSDALAAASLREAASEFDQEAKALDVDELSHLHPDKE